MDYPKNVHSQTRQNDDKNCEKHTKMGENVSNENT